MCAFRRIDFHFGVLAVVEIDSGMVGLLKGKSPRTNRTTATVWFGIMYLPSLFAYWLSCTRYYVTLPHVHSSFVVYQLIIVKAYVGRFPLPVESSSECHRGRNLVLRSGRRSGTHHNGIWPTPNNPPRVQH